MGDEELLTESQMHWQAKVLRLLEVVHFLTLIQNNNHYFTWEEIKVIRLCKTNFNIRHIIKSTS